MSNQSVKQPLPSLVHLKNCIFFMTTSSDFASTAKRHIAKAKAARLLQNPGSDNLEVRVAFSVELELAGIKVDKGTVELAGTNGGTTS
ncbi:hypothetical protein Ddye_027864 [Dipteronia dyeriana]|uniref:Uncharacterized protein n=1 Tax=Dipteronia dyeriana TaxID=168575 RepID=A0AAD9TQV6_9ROSI|nr:hypothetical protein Ddye_027864 [Dipteronia dyeriana]